MTVAGQAVPARSTANAKNWVPWSRLRDHVNGCLTRWISGSPRSRHGHASVATAPVRALFSTASPNPGQFDEHLGSGRQVFETAPFQGRVGVLLAGREVRRRHSDLGQPRTVGAATNDRELGR